MYQVLLFCHSLVRWLVLISLVYAIFRAYKGYFQNVEFGKYDHLTRHWTATFAHIQLIIGMLLYSQSPIVQYFWKNKGGSEGSFEGTFFGSIHIILMFLAIVILTVGSAMAKRRTVDLEKFKTILIWFSIALVLIFIAIPWPFSPLAHRPYIR